MANKKERQVNWIVAPFLVVTPIVAVAALVWYWSHGAVRWETALLALVMLLFTGFSITGGYHRYYSHRTYEAALPVRLFYILFGSAAFQGSVLQWCCDHRTHHAHVDGERDPYNIKEGFWHAHILWLIFKRRIDPEFKNCPDLKKDRLLLWQHKWYFPLGASMCFGFPALVASLWGDAIGGLLLAGFVRVVINHHFTFFINSLCHFVGNQPYSDRHSARDSWITALFTYGEGYHNYHHEFAADYRNGIRWYHFDPTKWVIYSLSLLGLTWNLRRIPQHLVIERQMAMDEKRLAARLVGHSKTVLERAQGAIREARERVQAAARKVTETHREYAEMKANALREQMQEVKARLARERRELTEALEEWSKLPQLVQSLVVH